MTATEKIAHALLDYFGIESDFNGHDIAREIDHAAGGFATEFVALHPGKGRRSAAVEAGFSGIRRGATVISCVEVVMTEDGTLATYSTHRTAEAYRRDGITDQDVLDYC